MTRIRLEYFDQNDAFAACLPRTGSVVARHSAVSGEGEWCLVRLDEVICYQLPAGESASRLLETDHLLLRSRWAGQEVGEPQETSVFILLVEPKQLPLTSPLQLEDYHHVAWGMCRSVGAAEQADAADEAQGGTRTAS